MLIKSYIDSANFHSLYDDAIEMFGLEKEQNCNNYILNIDKTLLLVIVACIEGNIDLDVNNNSWNIWIGVNNIKNKVDYKGENTYMLLSIYNFIKSNKGISNYIIEYFNLWHNKDDNDEFTYDKYHIDNIRENFSKLISIIKKDINKALTKKDSQVINTYSILNNVINKTFQSAVLSKKILDNSNFLI